MKKSFKNAYELATWIKLNIKCEFKQEQVMLQGIRNNYCIFI